MKVTSVGYRIILLGLLCCGVFFTRCYFRSWWEFNGMEVFYCGVTPMLNIEVKNGNDQTIAIGIKNLINHR